jgi:ASCH domain
VVRTTSVEVVAFDRVDAIFAHDEGEGDRSLTYWRDVHWAYFTRELAAFGRTPELDMPLVSIRRRARGHVRGLRRRAGGRHVAQGRRCRTTGLTVVWACAWSANLRLR